MIAKKQPAVFFDRDGTLSNLVLHDGRYTAPWLSDEFELKLGVERLLKRLGQAGFLRVVITNQPDLTYGHLNYGEHQKIINVVKRLPIDDVFVCSHGRDDGCNCRKPQPGMIFAAANKWNIDLPRSFIVGDTDKDIGAGQAAGCQTIHVPSVFSLPTGCRPDYVCENLAKAVDLIVSEGDKRD